MVQRRRRFSLRGLIRRWLDRALDNTFTVQLVALTFLTMVIASIGTAVAMYVLHKGDFAASSWWSWTRVIDPSVLAHATPDDEPHLDIAISVIIILFGWIVFGLLISIITTAFQERLERIKSGTAELLISDHTIVLGWNSTVFAAIDQLTSDDEYPVSEVVVMSEKVVSEMREEAVRYCHPKSLRRVHFRQGEIASVQAIRELKIRDARQVIVLGADDFERPDNDPRVISPRSSNVLKAVLACYQAFPVGKRKRDAYRMPIVAMVDSQRAARAVEKGAPAAVLERFFIRAIHTSDFLARLTAQIAGEPELARVYNELLCYEGAIVEGIDTSSEVYVVPIDKRMVGLTFDQCIMGYPKAIPFGYVASNRTIINPKIGSAEGNYAMAMGDEIILLANRKGDAVFRGQKPLPPQTYTPQLEPAKPKRVLVIGSGLKVRRILEQLPKTLPDGSKIATSLSTEGLDPGKCTYECPVETDDAQMHKPGAGAYTMLAGAVLNPYDRIVLADDTRDATRHDAQILMDLANMHAASPLLSTTSQVVVELLDYRNVELVRAYGPMAAVVSSQLASNYLVQLAIEPRRSAVFRELFKQEGCEIHIRSAQEFFTSMDERVSFDDLLARSRMAGMVLIGYLPPGNKPDELLPTERSEKYLSSHYGRLVVVSED